MSPIKLGPWPAGINNVLPATQIPFATADNMSAALVDAFNVDIDPTGIVTRRAGWQRIDGQKAHSLVEHDGKVFGVVGDQLGELTEGAFTAIAPMIGRVQWCELNGDLVGTTTDQLFVVRQNGIEALPYEIDPDEQEAVLTPMPGGSCIGAWNGRLLVGRGNSLLFSEPLRYGVYDALRSFVQFEKRISWIAPLAGGVFVGLRNHSVRWLAGTNPAELSIREVDGPTWRGAAAVIDSRLLLGELSGAGRVAVWFGRSGFVIGTPDGGVIRPQSSGLANLPLGEGRIVVKGNRVTVLSHK